MQCAGTNSLSSISSSISYKKSRMSLEHSITCSSVYSLYGTNESGMDGDISNFLISSLNTLLDVTHTLLPAVLSPAAHDKQPVKYLIPSSFSKRPVPE